MSEEKVPTEIVHPSYRNKDGTILAYIVGKSVIIHNNTGHELSLRVFDDSDWMERDLLETQIVPKEKSCGDLLDISKSSLKNINFEFKIINFTK